MSYIQFEHTKSTRKDPFEGYIPIPPIYKVHPDEYNKLKNIVTRIKSILEHPPDNTITRKQIRYLIPQNGMPSTPKNNHVVVYLLEKDPQIKTKTLGVAKHYMLKS